mmetsp:Transcript_58846/g.137442  ORF Transcript_58846/g.137442 Transcript_58846/m.137442 type:complete len:276 (-) Transcript_58846:112-939(-)
MRASRVMLSTASARLVFYDMVHSNNAARIRLWIQLKRLSDKIDTKMITYADLQSPEYARINPLKKVPGMLLEDGKTQLFESKVIMSYLEDRFGREGPSLVLDTPEARARVNLLCSIHDLYIASPNCTQPNFSHTQGAMYLPPYKTKHSSQDRAMDRPTRAAKLAEIWKQLTWLENEIDATPYMAGSQLSHADLTWYPTCIFMEYMLPRVFNWPAIFHEQEHFPKLCRWFESLSQQTLFAAVHDDVWNFWVIKDGEGQFDSIKDETKDPNFKWVYP